MFKFNFNEANHSSHFESADSEKLNRDQTAEILRPSEEVIVSENLLEKQLNFKTITMENFHLMVRDFGDHEDYVKKDEFLSKFYSSCDITPSIYEGGLKIWECTYDLVLYFIHNKIEFENKTVLDLGCGSGILGIYAAKQGARIVHFHDYNSEVLSKYTYTNVEKNEVNSNTAFYSGDWGSFCELPSIQNIRYDYILSSETLYNPANYTKLCDIFSKMMNSNGTIFLASKSYYFGIGGSTKQFQVYLDHLRKFKWSVVWKNNEGVQREIMSITLSKTQT